VTGILLTCLLLILAIGALIALIAYEHPICWWLYKRLGPRWWLRVIGEPCAQALAAALDPVDEHFMTAGGVSVVRSNHPAGCAKVCCWETRLTEMHDAFDWNAYEDEMRKTK